MRKQDEEQDGQEEDGSRSVSIPQVDSWRNLQLLLEKTAASSDSLEQQTRKRGKTVCNVYLYSYFKTKLVRFSHPQQAVFI